MGRYVDAYGRLAEIGTDVNGKYFAYIEQKSEYSPAFRERKNLLKWLEREGYREVTL